MGASGCLGELLRGGGLGMRSRLLWYAILEKRGEWRGGLGDGWWV